MAVEALGMAVGAGVVVQEEGCGDEDDSGG